MGFARGAASALRQACEHIVAITDPKQIFPLVRILLSSDGTLPVGVAPLVVVRPGKLHGAKALRPSLIEAYSRLSGKSSSCRWQGLVRLADLAGPLEMSPSLPLLTPLKAASSM